MKSNQILLFALLFTGSLSGMVACQQEVEITPFGTASGAKIAAITEGWASTTGYQGATTTIQQNVVRSANSAVGKSSGISLTDTKSKWLTDCAGGDGDRMRNAIIKYDKWYRANVKNRCASNVVPTSVRNDMVSSFNGSLYDATRKTALVNQIIDRYNSYACNSSVAVPTNDNSTLSFLNIQKQCLEWAETTGRNAGGSPRGYSAAGVASTKSYRPGMALYKTDGSHATILIDIYWSKTGEIVKVKVAESNWATGWINPLGAIPWQRNVGTRELTSLSGFKAVSFE